MFSWRTCMRINSTRNGRNKPTQQPVEALSHFTLALFTSRDVLRLAMSTLPQIMRLVFLVMFDVKSMSDGRSLGKPLSTKIWGLPTTHTTVIQLLEYRMGAGSWSIKMPYITIEREGHLYTRTRKCSKTGVLQKLWICRLYIADTHVHVNRFVLMHTYTYVLHIFIMIPFYNKPWCDAK